MKPLPKTPAGQLRSYSYFYLLAAAGLFSRSGAMLSGPIRESEFNFTLIVVGVQVVISAFAAIKFWCIHTTLRIYEAKADSALAGSKEQDVLENEFKNV